MVCSACELELLLEKVQLVSVERVGPFSPDLLARLPAFAWALIQHLAEVVGAEVAPIQQVVEGQGAEVWRDGQMYPYGLLLRHGDHGNGHRGRNDHDVHGGNGPEEGKVARVQELRSLDGDDDGFHY